MANSSRKEVAPERGWSKPCPFQEYPGRPDSRCSSNHAHRMLLSRFNDRQLLKGAVPHFQVSAFLDPAAVWSQGGSIQLSGQWKIHYFLRCYFSTRSISWTEPDGYQIPQKGGKGSNTSTDCRWDHCFAAACGQASAAGRPSCCCIQVTDNPMSHWCWRRPFCVLAPWHTLGTSAIFLLWVTLWSQRSWFREHISDEINLFLFYYFFSRLASRLSQFPVGLEEY